MTDDEIVDKITGMLYGEGVYKRGLYETAILRECNLTLEENKRRAILNRLFLEKLIEHQDDYYSPQENVRGEWGHTIWLSEDGRKLMYNHGSYLAYLKNRDKSQRSKRTHEKWDRGIKYFGGAFGIIGVIGTIVLGIKTLSQNSELKSIKQEVKQLTTERDSLLQLTSKPQGLPAPAPSKPQKGDTVNKPSVSE